jgi:hypothetical protein
MIMIGSTMMRNVEKYSGVGWCPCRPKLCEPYISYKNDTIYIISEEPCHVDHFRGIDYWVRSTPLTKQCKLQCLLCLFVIIEPSLIANHASRTIECRGQLPRLGMNCMRFSNFFFDMDEGHQHSL